jgi:hypothetical protein
LGLLAAMTLPFSGSVREAVKADPSRGDLRESAETHEVQPGDGIAFDELEREQRDHPGQPRHAEEGPAAIDADDQPSARAEKEERTGNDEPIVEDGDLPDELAKQWQV